MNRLQRFTYWALAAHVAKLMAPSLVPNTYVTALFVAIAGEAINFCVKVSVNRRKDFVTHWIPLLLVWHMYGSDIRREDVLLLSGLLVAYMGFHKFRFGAIYKLYT